MDHERVIKLKSSEKFDLYHQVCVLLLIKLMGIFKMFLGQVRDAGAEAKGEEHERGRPEKEEACSKSSHEGSLPAYLKERLKKKRRWVSMLVMVLLRTISPSPNALWLSDSGILESKSKVLYGSELPIVSPLNFSLRAPGLAKANAWK